MRPHIWSLQVRVSPARKARWQHLAAADNRTLSNWIAHTIEDATAETPDTIEHAGAQTEAPHVALQPPRPEAPPDTPSTSSTTPELPPPSHDPITADLTAHLDHTPTSSRRSFRSTTAGHPHSAS